VNSTEALFEAIYPKDGIFVIGLVAQVGTNLNDLCDAIKNRLANKKYDVELIHLSTLLADRTESIGTKQNKGNRLREEAKCQHVLSLAAVAEIQSRGKGKRGKRQAYIIRSLKRPEELEALRIIYGEAFLAIGVHTPRTKRLHYLSDVEGEEDPEGVVDTDETEDDDFFGQRTRDSFELCDAFIKGIDPEYAGLDRALRLLFGSVFTTPSKDELTMFMAHAASLRSADLSRQVGAAIMADTSEVVSVGCNEVPQFGGGQPWPNGDPGIRDFELLKYDPNIKVRDKLVNKFLESLNTLISERYDAQQVDLSHDAEVSKLLKKSGLLDITEFGKTVHAEMACLLSSLRNGIDVSNSTLCCTTFPCHNCVRHLVGAGVARIQYIEPYPKSRAKELYSDSCSFWDDDYNAETGKERPKANNAMRIEPFIGIGPRKYLDFFAMRTISGRRIERKSGATGFAIKETTASLKDLKWPSCPYGLLERESQAIDQLLALLKGLLPGKFPEIDRLLSSITQDFEAPKIRHSWSKSTDEPRKDILKESLTVETAAETASRKLRIRKPSTAKKKKETEPEESNDEQVGRSKPAPLP
jgi:deoxycytidylate deaminase